MMRIKRKGTKMFMKTLVALFASVVASSAMALEAPINGRVTSKCSIYTDVRGVYGQPTPDVLSTLPASGGVMPKIRYDVALADSYLAKITWPNSFSSSPNLTDSVNWAGEVEVAEVTAPAMSGYETNKVEYDNVVEFDLTVAGTVWFNVTSEVAYGYNKPFPGGNYTALVTAECIAK
jgi:hypothetical protein